MHARALDQFTELQHILQRHALRPTHRGRILHRPVEHHRHEQQHDEIEQQRRDHLVHTQPDAQQRGDQQQQCPGNHRRDHHRGIQQRGMRIEPGPAMQSTDHDRSKCAGIELALGPDVEEARAKSDRNGETGQDQRRGAGQRFAPRKPGTETAFKDEDVGTQQRRTSPRHEERGDEQRGHHRGKRRSHEHRA